MSRLENNKKAFNSVSVVPTEDIPEGSSFTAGERMHELVKVCLHLFIVLSCLVLLYYKIVLLITCSYS